MRAVSRFAGILATALTLLIPVAGASAANEPITVFAAASLKDALDEVAKAFRAAKGAQTRISYAGSLALARQIEQGAPADIFISADLESMNYAAERKAIRPESRFNLLQNSLVTVAAKSARFDSVPLSSDGFLQALGNGRLATGDVKSVPVGKYALAAMQKLGLWSALESRLAMTDNVRAALTFVTRGEAPLGIVYATDAAAEPLVKIVARFPADSHAAIVYPVALTSGSKNAGAAELLKFLKSDEARAIFEKQGFAVLK